MHTSHHITLHYITIHYITIHYIAVHYVQYTTSHHIISHRIASHHIHTHLLMCTCAFIYIHINITQRVRPGYRQRSLRPLQCWLCSVGPTASCSKKCELVDNAIVRAHYWPTSFICRWHCFPCMISLKLFSSCCKYVRSDDPGFKQNSESNV